MSEPKFVPPRQKPLLTRLLQSISYLVLYWLYKIRLVVDDGDIARVKAIAERRAVYLPNHSNLDDGLVMFLLSARLGQLFNYVVAYEAFRGFIGKLMQSIGAYSIRRGIGDRYSIVQTLKILQQPQCKLVIFPEGGCSYQNDTVIPFRSGAVELSFKAMEKIVKQEGTVPNFYLIPTSIKYYYTNAGNEVISHALKRLETALAIEPKEEDLYGRLRTVAEQVLTNLETEYRVAPSTVNGINDRADWNQRIETLRKRMLDYCEEKLEIPQTNQLAGRERVYKIQSVLSSLTDSATETYVDYEHIHLTTVRLLNFDAIYDGYIAAKPTPERFFSTIDRLEKEVFRCDRPKFKGWRKAVVKIGEPIDLKDYWQEYRRDRQPVIDSLTRSLQQIVQAHLD